MEAMAELESFFKRAKFQKIYKNNTHTHIVCVYIYELYFFYKYIIFIYYLYMNNVCNFDLTYYIFLLKNNNNIIKNVFHWGKK